SPASVSEAIRDLEERLGVRLFNRTTRSVALTEAGGQLLEQVGPALATIGDAVANIGSFSRDPVGTLRINGPRPAIEFRLMPWVLRFMAAYPGMRVEIVSEESFIDIVAAGFDAGVRYDESLDQDMIAVSLGAPQCFRIVGSPAYFASHGRPAHPEELVAHRCFSHIFPRGNQAPWVFEKAGRELRVAPHGPFATTDSSMALQAARQGFGLAGLFSEYSEADLAAGTLESVLDDWCEPFPGPVLYYPSRRLMPAGLRAFVDLIRAG
ncbi:MAG: transcriptional regulator, LysR family, partial [Rubritepida sp.]|nr:transcriptional regulator, LysR family [Rubritepida sp.]